MLKAKHGTALALVILASLGRIGKSHPTPLGTRIMDRKTNGSWEPTNNTFTLKDTYTFLYEGEMMLAFGSKKYLKLLDHNKLLKELSKVEKRLLDIDPSVDSKGFETLKDNFVISQLKNTPQQNMLKCHAIGETVDAYSQHIFRAYVC